MSMSQRSPTAYQISHKFLSYHSKAFRIILTKHLSGNFPKTYVSEKMISWCSSKYLAFQGVVHFFHPVPVIKQLTVQNRFIVILSIKSFWASKHTIISTKIMMATNIHWVFTRQWVLWALSQHSQNTCEVLLLFSFNEEKNNRNVQ